MVTARRLLCGLSSYYQPWASPLWLCASSLLSRRPTRTPLRVRKHRVKRRRFPPTPADLFRVRMLAAAQASRLPCLRLFPPQQSSGRLSGKACGSIATTVGWCSARTIGFIFGRTFSSGIEFPLPKLIPSLLAPPSKAASVSSAMTAAESISINPQMCSNTNKSFLTLSLPIRYFEILRAGSQTFQTGSFPFFCEGGGPACPPVHHNQPLDSQES